MNKFNRIFIERIFIGTLIFIIILTFYVNKDYFYDDAYITLRYANNFITGNGIVWNVGEYVQGYTNFLQLVLISLISKLTGNLTLSTYLLNFISYIALGVLIYNHRYFRENIYKNLILLTILSSSPLIVWTLGGLESVLFCFLILYSFLELESPTENKINYLLSGILINFAILTRPDGFIFAIIFIVLLFMKKESQKSILYFLPSFTIAILYFLWAYNYYGGLLPNTYYVKSYGLGTFKYEFGFYYLYMIITRPMFFIPLLIFLKIYYKVKTIYKFDVIAIIYLIYLIYIGGDHMIAFRFYIPIIPFIVLSIFKTIENKNIHKNIIYITLIILTLSQFMFSSLMPKTEDIVSTKGKLVANFINSNWEKNSLIALNTAGSIPYFANEYRYIDMLGLNDSVISKRKVDSITIFMQKFPGHSKGDGKYVLCRKPNYIIMASAEGTKDSILFLSDYEIYHSEEFKRNYRYYKALIEGEQDTFYFQYYKRKLKID